MNNKVLLRRQHSGQKWSIVDFSELQKIVPSLDIDKWLAAYERCCSDSIYGGPQEKVYGGYTWMVVDSSDPLAGIDYKKILEAYMKHVAIPHFLYGSEHESLGLSEAEHKELLRLNEQYNCIPTLERLETI